MKSANTRSLIAPFKSDVHLILWKRRFCKTMVLHAEKDVKEKTAKILRVKLSQKKPHGLWFYTGLSCAIMIPQNKQKCNERCRQCEIFV